jgi:hypothetical protein
MQPARKQPARKQPAPKQVDSSNLQKHLADLDISIGVVEKNKPAGDQPLMTMLYCFRTIVISLAKDFDAVRVELLETKDALKISQQETADLKCSVNDMGTYTDELNTVINRTIPDLSEAVRSNNTRLHQQIAASDSRLCKLESVSARNSQSVNSVSRQDTVNDSTTVHAKPIEMQKDLEKCKEVLIKLQFSDTEAQSVTKTIGTVLDRRSRKKSNERERSTIASSASVNFDSRQNTVEDKEFALKLQEEEDWRISQVEEDERFAHKLAEQSEQPVLQSRVPQPYAHQPSKPSFTLGGRPHEVPEETREEVRNQLTSYNSRATNSEHQIGSFGFNTTPSAIPSGLNQTSFKVTGRYTFEDAFGTKVNLYDGATMELNSRNASLGSAFSTPPYSSGFFETERTPVYTPAPIQYSRPEPSRSDLTGITALQDWCRKNNVDFTDYYKLL